MYPPVPKGWGPGKPNWYPPAPEPGAMAIAGLLCARLRSARAVPRTTPTTTTNATTEATISPEELELLVTEDDSSDGKEWYCCWAMASKRAGTSESLMTRARMLTFVNATALRFEPFGDVAHVTSRDPGIAGSGTSDFGGELVAPPQNDTAALPAAPRISSATRAPFPDTRTRITNTLLVAMAGSCQPSAAVSIVTPAEPMAACSTR